MKLIFKTSFLLTAITLSFLGCNKCKDLECFTPPRPFAIEFLDSETKENLISNGNYNFKQIQIKNVENGNSISFDSISFENQNFIQLTDIGWKTEIINYSISISNEFAFTFHVNAERLEGACCDFTQINEMFITNYEYEENTSSELISVFIKR